MALVITIVVLLILASVSITALLGDDGIIAKSKDTKQKTEAGVQKSEQKINALIDEFDSIYSDDGNPPADDPTKKVANNLNKVITGENADLTDSNGNKITVPVGFKIVTPEQDSTIVYNYLGDGTPAVQDGIVIEDVSAGDASTKGNQFVWVPVNDIKIKDGSTTKIKLGRYSDFTVTDGVLPTPAQEATEDCYNTPVLIPNYYFEVSDSFAGDGTYKSASEYGNTKATNLQEWITTTLANGGYYIARYEARKNDETNPTKAVSVEGKTVWADITQPNAAIAAKSTYPAPENNTTGYNYYSDLINSYAWDTAIIFIETFANSTYANTNNSKNGEGNNALMTTGANTDNVCNLNAMSGNVLEWSTETSTNSSTLVLSCTFRGGYYSTSGGTTRAFTGSRTDYTADRSVSYGSFRLTLYVK